MNITNFTREAIMEYGRDNGVSWGKVESAMDYLEKYSDSDAPEDGKYFIINLPSLNVSIFLKRDKINPDCWTTMYD